MFAATDTSETSHGRRSEVSEVERELKRTSVGPRTGASTGRGADDDEGESGQLLAPTGRRIGEEEEGRPYSRTRFVRHEDAGVMPGAGSTSGEEVVVDLPPLCEYPLTRSDLRS